MRLHVRTLLAAAFIFTGSSMVFAEQIDNPQYKMWTKFKAGTSVTTKIESDMAGSKSEIENTSTLLEISADKAVVENKMSMTTAGNKTDLPAQKMEIAAKVDKPADPPVDAPKPEVKESSETIDVAGTQIKCKVTESKTTMNGMNINSKTWTSEDVPGGLAKSESTTDGVMKGTSKIAVTAMTIK